MHRWVSRACAVIHPDPGRRVRLIGIRAPSRSSCDRDVRRQLGIYTIQQEDDDDGADAWGGNIIT